MKTSSDWMNVHHSSWVQSTSTFDLWTSKIYENPILSFVWYHQAVWEHAAANCHVCIFRPTYIYIYVYTCTRIHVLQVKHFPLISFQSTANACHSHPWLWHGLGLGPLMDSWWLILRHRQCLAPGTLSKALCLALCLQTTGFSRIFHIFPLFRPTWFQSNLLDVWIWTQKSALRSSGQAAQLPNSSPA